MASLNDIPTNILESGDADRFLTWLRATPIDFHTRRRFISLWQQATGATFTAEQVRFARITAIDSNGSKE